MWDREEDPWFTGEWTKVLNSRIALYASTKMENQVWSAIRQIGERGCPWWVRTEEKNGWARMNFLCVPADFSICICFLGSWERRGERFRALASYPVGQQTIPESQTAQKHFNSLHVTTPGGVPLPSGTVKFPVPGVTTEVHTSCATPKHDGDESQAQNPPFSSCFCCCWGSHPSKRSKTSKVKSRKWLQAWPHTLPPSDP